MILQAYYDEKYKRIIFFRDTDEYIYKTDLKTNGIHYALINDKYEFAIYLDAITQKRLDKTRALMQNRGWEIQINEDLFAQIGIPELDEKTYDERIECLFTESTYDVVNQQFINYQETIDNAKHDAKYLDADLWSSVLTVISNELSRLKWDRNNGVIDEALHLDVKKFVRQLIDDECERFRSYSRRYEVPLQTLYYRHQNAIIAPLDWAVRRNYVKVLMKYHKKVVKCQPSLLSTEQVLTYIGKEIDNGWDKNSAIVALAKLMTMIDAPSINLHDLYQSIKKGSFKPETQEAQRWLCKFQSSSDSVRNEAIYFFDPIIMNKTPKEVTLMNKEHKTVHQHTLAKTYQLGFADDNECVYSSDVILNKPNIYKNVSATCFQNDIYENKNQNAYMDRNFTEDALCEIEGEFATVKRKIQHNINIGAKYDFLTSSDKNILLNFICSQLIRPSHVFTKTRKEFGLKINKMISDIDLVTSSFLAQKMMLPSKSYIPTKVSYTTDQVLLTSIIKQMLQGLCFRFGVCEHELITCDAPIYMSSTGTADKCQLPNIDKLTFPLTTNIVLFLEKLSPISDFVFHLSKNDVDVINLEMAKRAHRYIISHSPISTLDFEHFIELNKVFKNNNQNDENEDFTCVQMSIEDMCKNGMLNIVNNSEHHNQQNSIIIDDKLNVTHENDTKITSGFAIDIIDANILNTKYLYYHIFCACEIARQQNTNIEWILHQKILIPDINNQEQINSLIELLGNPKEIINKIGVSPVINRHRNTSI